MSQIKNFASLVKFSHTIFALPFAFIGYFLAVQAQGSFDWQKLALVVLCMFFARNAAMSFNRWADHRFDAANPRTAQREIPQGIISKKNALVFCIANAALFVAATAFLNTLCLALSPVALAVILGYSLTKRFTALCHFILGLGLALSPIGAYIAVAGEFAVLPLLFSAVLLLWTAGFDILYALPDEKFDRDNRLYSIPSIMGRKNALTLSIIIHSTCCAIALYIGAYEVSSIFYRIGTTLFIACVAYQHSIVDEHNISRINLTFTTVNGVASITYAAFCIAALFL
ncbi:MAG: putative 4-hydroxybenzoate polyprenyltransferase [Prevotellaceae bacterium]|jgi:4-hydroxybenzoate polyprenyltransferase|nr:putative 4-hydroxybenzoate polyprenyltransferase [Prevotellaceae bacterium]